MKRSRLQVTDHALVRYMERAMGLDVERLRAEVGRKVAAAEAHPGCVGVVVDGVVFRIDGDHVVTVLYRGRRR